MTGATADILITRQQVERWKAERADLLQRITRLDRRLALIAEIVSEISNDAPRAEAQAAAPVQTQAPVQAPAPVAMVQPAAQTAPSIASTLEQALGIDAGLISAGVVTLPDPRDAASASHFRTLQPGVALAG